MNYIRARADWMSMSLVITTEDILVDEDGELSEELGESSPKRFKESKENWKHSWAFKYKTKFSKKWTKTWPFISAVPGDSYSVRCNVCAKTVSIAHQGAADICKAKSEWLSFTMRFSICKDAQACFYSLVKPWKCCVQNFLQGLRATFSAIMTIMQDSGDYRKNLKILWLLFFQAVLQQFVHVNKFMQLENPLLPILFWCIAWFSEETLLSIFGSEED